MSAIERYNRLPKKPWDGKGFLYSDRFDQYTQDPEQFIEDMNYDLEEDSPPITAEGCRFQLCEAVRAHAPDPNDLYYDDLPEDEEVSPAIKDLFDQLQAGLDALPESESILSWQPIDVAWNGE